MTVALDAIRCEEQKGCEMEPDPWLNHRFNDPLERGDHRIVLDKKGTYLWTQVIDDARVGDREDERTQVTCAALATTRPV